MYTEQTLIEAIQESGLVAAAIYDENTGEYPLLLRIAAENAFIHKVDNQHTDIIREALVDLYSYGFVKFCDGDTNDSKKA